MSYKTFSGGVEPGGLHSKQDIKVLICYILCNIKAMRKEDIISALQEDGLVNYFVAGEAFSELVSNGSIGIIDESSDEYEIKKSGKIISEQLYSYIPISVRQRAINAALSVMKRVKNEKENKVKVDKNKFGYNVTCSISGGEFDLLKFTIYVPDMDQAEKVKENFRKDTEGVYHSVLAVLTRKKEIDSNLKSMLTDLMD